MVEYAVAEGLSVDMAHELAVCLSLQTILIVLVHN
jgi:hypothetical protein